MWNRLEAQCLLVLEGTDNVTSVSADCADLGLTVEDAKDIVSIFKLSNPQYYFLGSKYGWAEKVDGNAAKVYSYIYDDMCDGNARQIATEAFRAKITEWIAQVGTGQRTEDKERIAHDLIANNTTYGRNTYDQSAYSMVCLGQTVCAGYAATMQLLMNAVGIETIVITSATHGWNAVRLHDEWYLVDVTWDDQDYGIIYNFYNKSEQTDDSHTGLSRWDGLLPEMKYDSNALTGMTHYEPYFQVGDYVYFKANDNPERGQRLARVIEALNGAPEENKPFSVENGTTTYYVIGASAVIPTPTYTVEGDTVTITGEGICWANGSELQSAISNAKHVVFRECKIQGSMAEAFYGCENLQSIDLTGLDTSQVTDMSFMFNQCSNLTSLDVSGFDTSKVVNMSYMFWGCSGVTSLDVSGFDTSKVTKMGAIFHGCSGVTSLDVSGFDTSKVTYMWEMFHGCSNLTSVDVSGFDTSQVTDMRNMFIGCANLTSVDVSGFDTSQVTNMNWMFSGCANLTSLDVSGFDTSKVTDMRAMFYGCRNLENLDVSGFNTSQVTDMREMFTGCNSLMSLDVSGFNTSQVTNMNWMFAGCSELTSLDVSGFDTSQVTGMGDMFEGCENLISLNLGNFDLSKSSSEDGGLERMLSGCKLQELRTPKALPAGCSIPLGHDYRTPDGKTTDVLTPEFISMTLRLASQAVEGKFTDVPQGAWFVSAVQYVYDHGIMTGKTATNFAPNANLTRAEFATVLYSQAGKPTVTYRSVFQDVEQGAWYSSPVLWAYDNGIVSGYANGYFGTSDKITREQLALMMYKYAQTAGYDTTSDAGILDSFSDKAAISSWARKAIQWATSHGIMSGKGNGADGKPMLDPKGNATRAECAAMIKKLLTME